MSPVRLGPTGRVSVLAGALASAACAAALAGVCACSSRPDLGFAVEAGAPDAAGDARARDAGPGPDTSVPVFEAGPDAPGSSPPPVFVRLANWSPDAPTAGYDVCLAAHGSGAWTGPLAGATIGDAGTLGDGGAPAVQFPVVTNYAFELDPGTYDVAVVPPGGPCAPGLATATALPALAAETFVTLAIVGRSAPGAGAPGLALVALLDEATTPGATTGVRFLNAAPAVARADFGTGTAASGFAPLALGVPFAGLAASVPADAGVTVDPAGYVAAALPAVTELSCRASTDGGAGADLATAVDQALAAGAVYTVALVGEAAPRLLVCAGDGVQDQSTGLLSACALQ